MEIDQLLQVREALTQLAADAALKAEVVKLRFFAGLTHAGIAVLLAVSEKTARRHGGETRIHLFQLITEG